MKITLWRVQGKLNKFHTQKYKYQTLYKYRTHILYFLQELTLENITEQKYKLSCKVGMRQLIETLNFHYR